MLAWQPVEGTLRPLIKYLNDSLSSTDPTARKQAETALKNAKESPDIDNYLCFLVASSNPPSNSNVGDNVYYTARCAAALMLKNHVKTHYGKIPVATRTYIKTHIFNALADKSGAIRGYAGNVVTEIISQGGLAEWPDALPNLLAMVNSHGGQIPPEAQSGAMSALAKICEDSKKELKKTSNGTSPLDHLIPGLLQATTSDIETVRAKALQSLNVFLHDKSDPLMSQLDNCLSQMFRLANDQSDEVRRQICRAVTYVVERAPEKILPHMSSLVPYMLSQQRTVEDPDLSLEAAEFWLALAEGDKSRDALGPYLASIVPVLLECMVYSEDDVIRLESEAEDADKEDRDQDIRPVFATSKAALRAGGANVNGNADHGAGYEPVDEDDLSEGEIAEEDDFGDDDPEDQWNVRKCSAAALDRLSLSFPQQVFETTLPYLMKNIGHTDWPNREAAVLAIGAISEGCMEAVKPHLPEIVPFLVSLLDDTQPMVRSIACWSLARYSEWASHLDSNGEQRFFLPMMDGILKRMLDNNKRVQETAASAFATLEEKSGFKLQNPQYSEVIARQFAECFARYKDRNVYILYDCVQTLAAHVGPSLQNPELVHYLMPALMKRWDRIQDASQEMFPLLECLSFVAGALGNTFSPYASQVFHRCIRIIYTTIETSNASLTNPEIEEPDKDFLVTSLDMISAIIQAIGRETTNLIEGSTPNLFELLTLCLNDTAREVRQSAFALLGDCAIHIFGALKPHLARILPILTSHLDPSSDTSGYDDPEQEEYPVANNACWSCGEICQAAGNAMSPYAETLFRAFFALLLNNQLKSTLRENAAIALGRLCGACPDLLAPGLATFAAPFLNVMARIAWTEEKAFALKGFTECAIRNPQGLQHNLLPFLAELGKMGDEHVAEGQEDPRVSFKKVLTLYKENMPDFAAMVSQLPPESQQRLSQLLTA